MLVKLNILSHTIARQERVENPKELTKRQWIYIDRVVMALLFIGIIVAAIVFSD